MNHGCVYVAVADNGLIKVGKAVSPEIRISQIKAIFKRMGTSMKAFRSFDRIHNNHIAESRLILYMNSMGKPHHGREWFMHGNFDDVCRVAEKYTERQKIENILEISEILPDGWCLVPVDPNQEMISAAGIGYKCSDFYRKMIGAYKVPNVPFDSDIDCLHDENDN